MALVVKQSVDHLLKAYGNLAISATAATKERKWVNVFSKPAQLGRSCLQSLVKIRNAHLLSLILQDSASAPKTRSNKLTQMLNLLSIHVFPLLALNLAVLLALLLVLLLLALLQLILLHPSQTLLLQMHMMH